MLRWCKDCSNEIVGRSDKQFCGDACRSNYHNKRRAEEKKEIYCIDQILKRNRKLLLEYNRSKVQICSKNELLKKGFDFSYFTHSKQKNGTAIYYCYDLGYEELADQLRLFNDQSLATDLK